jgi:Fe-S-cluster containining protein
MNKTEVIEAPPEKKLECKRCGQCCSQIVLPVSPIRLKRLYQVWNRRYEIEHSGGEKHKKPAKDIWLLYPMLVFIKEAPEFAETTQDGNYQGKKYTYRCKHLIWERGKATCTIHDTKPWMCSDYGKIPVSQSKKGVNSYYPNCVWLS